MELTNLPGTEEIKFSKVFRIWHGPRGFVVYIIDRKVRGIPTPVQNKPQKSLPFKASSNLKALRSFGKTKNPPSLEEPIESQYVWHLALEATTHFVNFLIKYMWNL